MRRFRALEHRRGHGGVRPGTCFSPEAPIASLQAARRRPTPAPARPRHAAARLLRRPASGTRSVCHDGLRGIRAPPTTRSCSGTAAASGASPSLPPDGRSTCWSVQAELEDGGRGARRAGADRARAAVEPLPSSWPRDAPVPRWRSAWPPTTLRRSCSAPAGVDPGPEPPQLGVRDQRRRLRAGAACRAARGRRRRPALRALAAPPPAGLLPELRARAGAGPARRPVRGLADQDDGWHPDKLPRCSERSASAAHLQRRASRRSRRAADLGHLLEQPAQQPHRSRPRCWSPTR